MEHHINTYTSIHQIKGILAYSCHHCLTTASNRQLTHSYSPHHTSVQLPGGDDASEEEVEAALQAFQHNLLMSLAAEAAGYAGHAMPHAHSGHLPDFPTGSSAGAMAESYAGAEAGTETATRIATGPTSTSADKSAEQAAGDVVTSAGAGAAADELSPMPPPLQHVLGSAASAAPAGVAFAHVDTVQALMSPAISVPAGTISEAGDAGPNRRGSGRFIHDSAGSHMWPRWPSGALGLHAADAWDASRRTSVEISCWKPVVAAPAAAAAGGTAGSSALLHHTPAAPAELQHVQHQKRFSSVMLLVDPPVLSADADRSCQPTARCRGPCHTTPLLHLLCLPERLASAARRAALQAASGAAACMRRWLGIVQLMQPPDEAGNACISVFLYPEGQLSSCATSRQGSGNAAIAGLLQGRRSIAGAAAYGHQLQQALHAAIIDASGIGGQAPHDVHDATTAGGGVSRMSLEETNIAAFKPGTPPITSLQQQRQQAAGLGGALAWASTSTRGAFTAFTAPMPVRLLLQQGGHVMADTIVELEPDGVQAR